MIEVMTIEIMAIDMMTLDRLCLIPVIVNMINGNSFLTRDKTSIMLLRIEHLYETKRNSHQLDIRTYR